MTISIFIGNMLHTKVLVNRPKRPQRHYNPKELPEEWIPMDTRTPEVFEKIELSHTSLAFKETEAAFKNTMMSEYKVRSIHRIQNLTHWKNYQR